MTSSVDHAARSLLLSVKSRVSAAEQWTHTTTGEMKENWNIDTGNLPMFFNAYCRAVYEHKDYKLGEKVGDEVPLRFEMSIPFLEEKDENDNPPHQNQEALAAIVNCMQLTIMETYEIPEEGPELLCIFNAAELRLIPPSPSSGSPPVYIAELVFHFPFFKFAKGEFDLIRAKLLQSLHARNALRFFKLVTPYNATWDQMLIAKTYSKPLTMYGSSDYPGQNVVLFSTLYGPVNGDDVFSDNYKADDYDPIANPGGKYTMLFKEEDFPLTHHRYLKRASLETPHGVPWTYWLPIIMSTGYYDVISSIRRIPLSPESSPMKITPSGASQATQISVQLEWALQLLDIISPDRWKDRQFRLDVGKALHTISCRNTSGLQIWIKSVMKYMQRPTFGHASGLSGPTPMSGLTTPPRSSLSPSILTPLPESKLESKEEEKPTPHSAVPTPYSAVPTPYSAVPTPTPQLKETSRPGARRKINDLLTIEQLTDAYGDFTETGITLKTIAWHAKEDNPTAYQEWHIKSYLADALNTALQATHADIAAALYRAFWLDFIYDPDQNAWYQYRKRDHVWVEVKGAIELARMINCAEEPDNFVNKFERLRAHISANIARSTDDAKKKEGENSMTNLGKVIKSLKTDTFTRSVINMARSSFRQEGIFNRFDSDPNKIGVFNGVIQVDHEKATYRQGMIEDWIFTKTAVPYLTKYTDCRKRGKDHQDVIDVLEWLHQMFVDIELFDHVMCICSSWLKGGNAEKKVPFFTGEEGDNSKSMFVKLIEATFGPYCVKMPNSAITVGKSQPGSASPELAQLKVAHVGFFEELKQGDVIDEGKYKKASGGDSMRVRALYSNGMTIKIWVHFVVVCNKIPTFLNPDKATEERTAIIPFLSRWVDDAPESKSEQYRLRRFKKDPFFEEKIPRLAPAFLWLLVEWFPIYLERGLRTPDIVKQHTKEYWDSTDIYHQFAADAVEMALGADGKPDPTSSVSITELYDEYKDWYRRFFPGTNPVKRATLIQELKSRWGPPGGNAWAGIRLKQKENAAGGAFKFGRGGGASAGGGYNGF